jgi:hypothetical protein
MRCYHLLWCIENLIVPVRYHYSNNFDFVFSQWRARLQEVLLSTLVCQKGGSVGEIFTRILLLLINGSRWDVVSQVVISSAMVPARRSYSVTAY